MGSYDFDMSLICGIIQITSDQVAGFQKKVKGIRYLERLKIHPVANYLGSTFRKPQLRRILIQVEDGNRHSIDCYEKKAGEL